MLYYSKWFSKSATHYMGWVLCFHDVLMTIVMFIAVFVTGLVIIMWTSPNVVCTYTHDEPLEVAWTVFPIAVFVFLAFPSITLLYLSDKESSESDSGYNFVKAMAHQWYWEYEQFIPFIGKEPTWDSFMTPLSDLKAGEFYLLEVDKPIVLPLKSYTNFLVTSADVLHSFAIPSFGIKVDCVPGRINQSLVNPKVLGVFYGQCSEICGANHSYMPMSAEVYLK